MSKTVYYAMTHVLRLQTSAIWRSMVGLALKKEYHITVLGGRGVGKTSLLATLYHQFVKNPDNQFNLKILSDDHKTSLVMDDKLRELSSNAENEIITGLGQGSGDKVSYVFNLGLKGLERKMEMKLIFNDYPGGWFRSEDKCKEITEHLSASNVILWVIDAAALMVKDEKNASYFRFFNMAEQEKKLLRDGITSSNEKWLKEYRSEYKKVILLVPVKCETWCDSVEDTKALCKQIEDEFKPFLDDVKKGDKNGEQFAVAITPVHTLGGMRFNRVEKRSGEPCFIFTRKGQGSNYQPRYGDQVLAYSLSYITSFHSKFHGTSEFTNELGKLVKQRLQDERLGFKVLHGNFNT